jgi:hypothetical protein
LFIFKYFINIYALVYFYTQSKIKILQLLQYSLWQSFVFHSHLKIEGMFILD